MNTLPINKVFYAIANESKKARYFYKEGTLYKMSPNSRRRGYAVEMPAKFEVVESVKKPVDILASYDKVIKLLTKSGLNPKFLQEVIEVRNHIAGNEGKVADDFKPEGASYLSDMFHGALKIKKMEVATYLPKESDLIAQAISTKTAYKNSFKGRSYDISKSYSPEHKDYNAWYSEEFRNCGNGHYFLMLDETYAVYSEDD